MAKQRKFLEQWNVFIHPIFVAIIYFPSSLRTPSILQHWGSIRNFESQPELVIPLPLAQAFNDICWNSREFLMTEPYTGGISVEILLAQSFEICDPLLHYLQANLALP